MRKNILFFLVICICVFAAGSVFASPEDVTLVPLTRYNYKNVDGYGFYDKCADFSWFGMVFRNETKSSYTISLPDEVRITGWNGTRHPVANTRYIKLENSITDFRGIDRTGTPFSGDMTLPANSIYAIIFDVTKISAYNIYWDTNVFFKITISDGSTSITRNISGILAQRGNACAPDAVCSAEILSGEFASNGSGNVIIRIKNKMPDNAKVTAYSNVDISWTDASGTSRSHTAENGVTWTAQPNWIASGSEKTISGSLSLPVDIASANEKLTLTFHFHHPSSLFFGDFSGTKEIGMIGGLNGTISGSYEADGSGGTFTAVLNNHQDKAVSVTLPGSGTVKAADGKSYKISLTWRQNSPVKIDAYGKKELSGTFKFSETGFIHNNSSLIMAADLKAGDETGTAAGTITRNPDPAPVIKSLSFCRNFNSADGTITFTYSLRNDSFIDIPLQLAGTLAVEGQVKNASIKYTACESQGNSCFSRIDGLNFTLEAGETAVFSGIASPDNIPADDHFSIRTSLLYYPDGKSEALYVGSTSAACSEITVPTTVPTEKPTTVPTAVPTDKPTAVPTTAPTDKPAPVSTAAPTDNPTDVPTTVPTDKPTAVPTDKPTEAPIVIPTDIPQPTQPAEPAVLEASVISASYSQCKNNPVLQLIMVIRNSGDESGQIDISSLSFTAENKELPAEFTSCVKMSASGNEDCMEEAGSGSVTVLPDVSLRLEGQYLPEAPIEEDKLSITVKSEQLTPSELTFTAASSGKCTPVIETIPNTSGNDISSDISNDNSQVTLSVHLVNSGSADEVIRPGTIYLHQAAIEDYQAIVSIDPLSNEPAGKAASIISRGESFTLPMRHTADISVSLDLSETAVTARRAAVNWNFSIGNSSRNYTGTILFRQNGETVRPRVNSAYNFFVLDDSVLDDVNLPEKLPATGFPVQNTKRSAVKYAHPDYKPLNGLHLEIPTVNAEMDVVQIPLNSAGEWAVDDLEEKAGVLDISALPGQGTSIIAGHNHLDEMRIGPFLNLYQLEKNDRIFITDENGQFLIFSVYANDLVAPDQSDAVYKTAIPGSLVLMTCESELPEGGYAFRRLVYAEPLQ